MSVRASMTDLLRRLRVLVGDTNAVTWTDDRDLQDMLDAEHQTVHRYLPLRAEPTRTGGAFLYKDFYSDGDVNNWEADVVISDAAYNPLTAETADLLVGHWSFTANQNVPVFATGKTYDLFAAAADMLEAEAATLRRRFDTTDASGASMKRSQEVTNLLTLAARYRSKTRVKSGAAVRSDGTGGGGGSLDTSRWAGRGGWTPTGNPNA